MISFGKRFFRKKDVCSLFALDVTDAYVLFGELQHRLQTRCHIPISYAYNNDGKNLTVDKLDNGVHILVQSSYLSLYESDVRHDIFARMPGRDVVATVVTFCHETEHAVQIEKAHDKNADPVHAMRYLIDERNRFLYDAGGSRYWHNTSEIESERRGVLDAGHELHKMFPNVHPHVCTQAVEEYVNSRCFVGSGENAVSVDYFIRPQAQHPEIAEVRRLFDTAARQGYPFCYSGNALGAAQKDEFLQMVYFQGRKSPWWEVMSKLNQAETELESIKIVYAVSLMRHPEDIQKYPSLAKIQEELQPDNMFGEGFLERVVAYDKDRGADISYADNVRRTVRAPVENKTAGKQSARELPVIDGESIDFGMDFLNR